MKKSLVTLAGACLLSLPVLAPPSGAAPGAAPDAAPDAAERLAPRVVAHADVDADGRADEVAVRRLDDRRCAVRVVTAAGVRSRVVLRTQAPPVPCAYHGAAALDGHRGAELFVVTTEGAHAAFETVLTWRLDSLVVETNPATGVEWPVDAAVSSYAGWRQTRLHGERRLVQTVVSRSRGSRFTGERRVLAYRHGAWVWSGHRAVSLTARQARAVGGWHVSGLSRYPRS